MPKVIFSPKSCSFLNLLFCHNLDPHGHVFQPPPSTFEEQSFYTRDLEMVAGKRRGLTLRVLGYR
jgi:hypothetical protein